MIAIISEKCIRCGHCVRVCPSRIFTQKIPKGEVGIVWPETCIVCGHCAAVCPTGAVEHSEFPPSKVHAIDYADMPKPEQVLLLCRARRSNRAMSSAKPIPAPYLDMILEAAHRAPTASNAQTVAFTVVTDPAKLLAIRQYVIDVFSGVLRKVRNPLIAPLVRKFMPDVWRYIPVFERLREKHAAGEDLILRGATAVVFIHTPTPNRFGAADANLAYQNGSLMAESLGVSQVYTGFVLSALGQDKKKRLAQILGIPKDRAIHAGMALGVPEFRYPNYIDRKEIKAEKL